MPRLELTGRELIVHLRWWESLLALRGSVRVPLEHVRGATEDNGFRGLALGLRIPGTHIPGVLTAGTFRRGGDRQFVYIRPPLQTVVIEMANDAWTRLIIGVRDARGEAARINAAVARR
jgi:hypothetical protein